MLNLYLKLSLTSFKNKFQQKQLAFYKSYASAQSENPELSHAGLDRSYQFLYMFNMVIRDKIKKCLREKHSADQSVTHGPNWNLQ